VKEYSSGASTTAIRNDIAAAANDTRFVFGGGEFEFNGNVNLFGSASRKHISIEGKHSHPYGCASPRSHCDPYHSSVLMHCDSHSRCAGSSDPDNPTVWKFIAPASFGLDSSALEYLSVQYIEISANSVLTRGFRIASMLASALLEVLLRCVV